MFLKKIFWDLSGLHFIWTKISPELDPITQRRPPATILIWFLGVYVAFFGVASQRYENKIDIIENRSNAVYTMLSTKEYKKALSRISRIQNMPCPTRPKILSPISVFKSLFGGGEFYYEMVGLLKETIEDWKSDLDYVDLSNANLKGLDLEGANLKGANLKGTILKGVNLKGAKLDLANLENVDFKGANLEGASLISAKVMPKPWHVVRGTINPREVEESEQFSKVKTLYNAELPELLRLNLEKNYPQLFEAPTSGAFNLRLTICPQ